MPYCNLFQFPQEAKLMNVLYKLVEVSGHNLASSQTWDFRTQYLHYITSFKPLLFKEGGEGAKPFWGDFCPNYFQEFGLSYQWVNLWNSYIVLTTKFWSHWDLLWSGGVIYQTVSNEKCESSLGVRIGCNAGCIYSLQI